MLAIPQESFDYGVLKKVIKLKLFHLILTGRIWGRLIL